MSERGVFAVDRGVFDHELFADEPYTEREAWLWLIAHAAWKPKVLRVGTKVIHLDRGQLAFSERFLAEKWQWPKTRVHRYLYLLKSESMIGPDLDQGMSRITICNYNKYAFDGLRFGPQIGPQSGPLLDHLRTKEKEIEEPKKEEKKEQVCAVAPATRTSTVEDFETFWTEYPKRGTASNPKKPAREKFARLVKSGVDPGRIIAGVKAFAAIEREAGREGTEKVAQAITWLNQERFNDYADADGAPTGMPDWLTPEQRIGWAEGWRPGMPPTAGMGRSTNGRDHTENLFPEGGSVHRGDVERPPIEPPGHQSKVIAFRGLA